MFRRITLFILMLVFSLNLFAYEVVDRFKLYDDRLKTMEMLRPYGHDFIFNIGAALNPDVMDTVDDAKELSKTEGGSAAQLAAAQEFLTKHSNEEYAGRFDLHFGIPLPSFTISGIKIVPDIRFGTNVGLQVGTVAVPLTAATVVDLLGPEVPQDIVNSVVARYDSTPAGNTLITDDDCDTILGGHTGVYATACQDIKDKYKKPANPNIADLFAYVKYESRLGLQFGGYKGHFFGAFSPYLRHRADLKRRYTAEFLATEDELFEKDELIDFIDLTFDTMFGYKNKNWKIFARIEEIKIAEIKKNVALDGTRYSETFYGNDPLFRLHSDYTFKFIGFKLVPFAGFHFRSGYDFIDGGYVGADLGWSFWKDRFGILAKGMIDSQYLTVAPRLQLWFLQLELMAKIAHQSKDEDMEIPNFYAFNLRLFF